MSLPNIYLQPFVDISKNGPFFRIFLDFFVLFRTNRAHTNFDFLLVPFRLFATQRFLIAGKLLTLNC